MQTNHILFNSGGSVLIYNGDGLLQQIRLAQEINAPTAVNATQPRTNTGPA